MKISAMDVIIKFFSYPASSPSKDKVHNATTANYYF